VHVAEAVHVAEVHVAEAQFTCLAACSAILFNQKRLETSVVD